MKRAQTMVASGTLAMLLASPAATQDPTPAASPSPSLVLDRFTWGKEVDGPAPIRSVEVHNDYGDVRARFTDDRRLEAHAVIQRLGAPPGAGVTVERRGDVIALTVAYPPGRIQDSDPEPPKTSYDRLDLVVFVPAGITFAAHTLRGMVEARGLQSDVRAATRQGTIEVRATGAIDARSQDGSITASLSEKSEGPFLFRSEGGSITLTLPAAGGFDARAETSGALSTAIPLSRARHGDRTRAIGHIGPGGPLLLLSSATGRVELERAKP
jgi:hypothetical protein